MPPQPDPPQPDPPQPPPPPPPLTEQERPQPDPGLPPESAPFTVPPSGGGWLPPQRATAPLSVQAAGAPRPLTDGYDLGDWDVLDVTPEEAAAALRAAGVTPGEYHAPDWGTAPVVGQNRANAPSRFWFRRGGDGVVRAWRNGEVEPEDPSETLPQTDETGTVLAT